MGYSHKTSTKHTSINNDIYINRKYTTVHIKCRIIHIVYVRGIQGVIKV